VGSSGPCDGEEGGLRGLQVAFLLFFIQGRLMSNAVAAGWTWDTRLGVVFVLYPGVLYVEGS
jgi:hypothetical protein